MAVSRDEIVIPKWFLYLVSGFITLFVPWASWVTMTLATMSVRMEMHSETQQRIARIEERLTEHVQNPNFHQAYEGRFGVIEGRLERLERARAQ